MFGLPGCPIGTMSGLYRYPIDKEVQLSNPKTQLVIKFDDDKLGTRCPVSPFKFGPVNKEELTTSGSGHNEGALPSRYRVSSLISIQKYDFMNKTNRQCSSITDFNLCEANCIREQVIKKNLSCRLPFMFGYDNLPMCEDNYRAVYFAAMDSYLGLWKSNASTADCKCTATCERKIMSSRLIVEEKAGSIVTTKVIDSIRIAKEVPSYGIIALFCDLGGNIGLTLGVSCLMLSEMLFILITLIIEYIKKSKKKSSIHHLILKKRVEKYLKIYGTNAEDDLANSFQFPGLQYILINQCLGDYRKCWWIFLVVIASSVCCFQIYDRILYYLSYPKTISMSMNAVEYIELPSMVLCADSGKLNREKKKFMKKNEISGCPSDFDMLNMVTEKISAKEVWRWSRLAPKFMTVKKMTKYTQDPILPFMNSTLDMCKDAKSAKFVKSEYISVMLKTDPIKTCNCTKPCIESIYYPEVKLLMDYDSPAIQLVVRVEHNLEEVIEEVLSFPFVKLLCDMGSNMGVVLGMSVMSFLHDILQSNLCGPDTVLIGHFQP
uniref:Uncharacterized protein n=1 Tax=Strigamia maritima TaxID=126957 RepID=T1JF12_STRMM